MSLIPWRGKQREGDDSAESSPVSGLRQEMDRLFDRFLGGGWGLTREGAFPSGEWVPLIDVSETETEVVVRAEVAGVDPKDIEVSLSGQVLTVAGEKKESKETQTENWHRSERRFGSFRRTLQLSASVDTEKVAAEHKNGVLLIRLKKVKNALPKKIQVRLAGADEK